MISFPQIIFDLSSEFNRPFKFPKRPDGLLHGVFVKQLHISFRKPLECQVLVDIGWESQKPTWNSLSSRIVRPAGTLEKWETILETKGRKWIRIWQVTGVRGNSQHPLLGHVVSGCNFSLCISFILLSLQLGFLALPFTWAIVTAQAGTFNNLCLPQLPAEAR